MDVAISIVAGLFMVQTEGMAHFVHNNVSLIGEHKNILKITHSVTTMPYGNILSGKNSIYPSYHRPAAL
ncbi:hypothetical protein CEXT_3241 [Caerostris extrusa]|uniref:Uncharacterized protein n=1 Tax=Caerostris extrusa TaxID=172846 RepID=A0AAV4SH59_CAEEX|nr:hypothetical protein CEXT_3241 [Caerostris extrusa]